MRGVRQWLLAMALSLLGAAASARPTAPVHALFYQPQLADRALGREGRMIRAVERMGPGAAVLEGRPFHINLE